MILSPAAPVTTSAFAEATGWHVRPEGACRGEVCVPAPGSLRDDGTVDISILAERLGMPIVTDEQYGVAAIGPSTLSGRALPSAVAADPELIDRNGQPFRLSSLRGRKVLLVAWSSY